jgi:RimJ/RimL family protein N-acetyltransferase
VKASAESGEHSVPHELNHLGQPVGFVVPDWKPAQAPTAEPLEGRYCRVERLDPDRHAESLFHANALDREGRMWTYLSYGPFDRLESYREWAEQHARSQDPLFHAIVDRDSGRAVGIASYLRIDRQNGVIEVGHLAYSPLLQRTRAATEAMYLMMKHAFDSGYRRYEWKCNSLNLPSRAAAKRLGFTFEGVFRQAVLWRGRNRDTAWFSILDTEWPRLDAAFRQWLDPRNFDAAGGQKVRLSELTAAIRD